MGMILRDGGTILRDAGTIARDDGARSCCCKCCCIQFNNAASAEFPQTLIATIDAPGCPSIDGKTITLEHQTPSAAECVKYTGVDLAICQGSVTLADVSLTLSLRCTNLYPTGDTRGFCTEFELEASSVSSGCHADVNKVVIPPDTCTCSPLSLTFSGFVLKDNAMVTGDCDCCPGGFSIVITEPE